MIQADII